MFLFKMILKILILPLLAALILVKWIGIFLTGFSAIFFNLFADVFFVVAVGSFVMGICNGGEAAKILALGFAIFVTPYIAQWLLTGIALISYNLSEFIRS